MPTKATRSSASRRSVQVVLRAKRSIALVSSAGKRAEARSGTNVTLPASPSAAAATARQKSTSRPDQRPDPSWDENPTMPSLTPQRRVPRALTSSSVAPAQTGDTAKAHTSATVATKSGRTVVRIDRDTRGIIADPRQQSEWIHGLENAGDRTAPTK